MNATKLRFGLCIMGLCLSATALADDNNNPCASYTNPQMQQDCLASQQAANNVIKQRQTQFQTQFQQAQNSATDQHNAPLGTSSNNPAAQGSSQGSQGAQGSANATQPGGNELLPWQKALQHNPPPSAATQAQGNVNDQGTTTGGATGNTNPTPDGSAAQSGGTAPTDGPPPPPIPSGSTNSSTGYLPFVSPDKSQKNQIYY